MVRVGLIRMARLIPTLGQTPMRIVKWLKLAKALYTELPDLTETVQGNLATLKSELTDLDARNDELFAMAGGINFAANHPSYSYLMRSQEIAIENFDLDPEGELDADEVSKIEVWQRGAQLNSLAMGSPTFIRTHYVGPEEFDHYTIDPLEAPVNGTYNYIAQYKANQKLFAQIITDQSKDSQDSKAVTPEK